MPYVSCLGAWLDVFIFFVELIVFYFEVFFVFFVSLVPVFWQTITPVDYLCFAPFVSEAIEIVFSVLGIVKEHDCSLLLDSVVVEGYYPFGRNLLAELVCVLYTSIVRPSCYCFLLC